MQHTQPTIQPRDPLPPIGKCIWCGRVPPDVELRSEHAIPKSLGGNWVLPEACCRDCEKDQSAYIGKCCDRMFAALRFHHGLPISTKKKLSERTVRVLTKNDEQTPVTHDKAPGAIFLPVLDFPRALTSTASSDGEFLMLGAYVSSTTDDASERQIALQNEGHKVALAYAEVPITEFIRLLAHIGHAYYMMSADPIRRDSLMLPIAQGEVRLSSQYLGGWFLEGGRLPEPKGVKSIHQILPFNARIDDTDYIAANIRLFTHLRPLPPTYTLLLAKRPIPQGDAYYLFPGKECANRMNKKVTVEVA